MVCSHLAGQNRGLFVPDGQGGLMEAVQEKRIALLIGNKHYSDKSWAILNNPHNDVDTMENTLISVGFEVMKLKDATYAQIVKGVNEFVNKVDDAQTVALVYFAGHGTEYQGENYLISSDDPSVCMDELPDYNVKLSSVYQKLTNRHSTINILIVDACRNVPKPLDCGKRGTAAGGLTPYAPHGSYIAFSTAPGTFALDGEKHQNSPYVQALARAIKTPGLNLQQVFDQTKREVFTRFQQRTWEHKDLIGDFYFIPSPAKPANQDIQTMEDKDGDGIADQIDRCPDEPGPAKNEGCPETQVQSFSRTVNGVSFNMVALPGGTYRIGCPVEDQRCSEQEKPDALVNISPFEISHTEVTQIQWRAIMGIDPPHLYNKNCDLCPVEGISWKDAIQFINKLNSLTGQKYRLPTEAEWEYAAKGGNKHHYSGSDYIDEVGYYDKNYKQNNSGIKGTTNPVGKLKPNRFGLYDMSGNVWEWCEDNWYDSHRNRPADGSARNSNSTSSKRVYRGGSWGNAADRCRVTSRSFDDEEVHFMALGFRLAADL